MVVLLTAALWGLFFFAVGGVARGLLPNKLEGCFRSIDWFSGFVVHRTTSRLFGLAEKTRTKASLEDEAADPEEEWEGRLAYIEKAFERQLAKTQEDLKQEIISLEKRLYEHDECKQAEKLEEAVPAKVRDSVATTNRSPASNHRRRLSYAAEL